MPTPFFITGLPRSRTAWLANFFTTGNVFCHHEALRQVNAIAELPVLMNRDDQLVGDSDPMLLLHYDAVMNFWPNARVLFIRRDVDDARKSFDRLAAENAFMKGLEGSGRASFDALRGAYDEILGRHPIDQGLEVLFEEIDDDIEAIWDFCLGGPGVAKPPFDHTRFKMLQAMYVDTIPAHAVKTIAPKLMEQLKVASSNPTALHIQYVGILDKLCGTDRAASIWIQQLFELLLTWDHIVDRDELDVDMAERVFENVLLDWSMNPFWLSHSARLAPVLSNCLAAWRDERTHSIKGWDAYTEVPCAVAFLLGGPIRVRQFSEQIRRLSDAMRAEDNACDETLPKGQLCQ